MTDAIIVALIALVGTIFTSILTAVNSRKSIKSDEIKNQFNQLSESIKTLDEKTDSHIKSDQEEGECFKESLKVLLRHNIDDMYDKYSELGYLPLPEKEDLEETYQAYRSVKGNHNGERKYKILINLPDKLPIKEKENK